MARIAFDSFEFDSHALELTRGGENIPLQQQPARVLALLLARRGELVTRDELRAAIWGDDTFVDFNRSLNFCVSQIRASLGDDADEPRFVETLRGRGYRFTSGTHVPDVPLVPQVPDVPQVRRWGLVALIAAVVLAPVAWGIAAISPSGTRIAIARFDAADGSADWAETLHSQVLAHLAHGGTRVVDQAIARRGDAAAWHLRGRVDLSDEQYRVTVTLHDADGAVRFTDIFDGPPGDWIEAQNEMARIISQAVRYHVEGPAAIDGIERRAPRRKIPFS